MHVCVLFMRTILMYMRAQRNNCVLWKILLLEDTIHWPNKVSRALEQINISRPLEEHVEKSNPGKVA